MPESPYGKFPFRPLKTPICSSCGCPVWGRVPPGWRPPKLKDQDPVAPLKTTTGTRDSRLSPFYPVYRVFRDIKILWLVANFVKVQQPWLTEVANFFWSLPTPSGRLWPAEISVKNSVSCYTEPSTELVALWQVQAGRYVTVWPAADGDVDVLNWSSRGNEAKAAPYKESRPQVEVTASAPRSFTSTSTSMEFMGLYGEWPWWRCVSSELEMMIEKLGV